MGLEPIVKVGCSDVVNLCSVQGYSISVLTMSSRLKTTVKVTRKTKESKK